VVFQGHDSLYDWLTALDNIGFGLRLRGLGRGERRAKAEHYLKMVGLTGQGAKHPSELSGGMKQRIQIARALANDPRMLLMDEPFGALDAMTRAVLQGELSRIWAETKKTVLFITHDIEEAVALATRVGVMKRGPGRHAQGRHPGRPALPARTHLGRLHGGVPRGPCAHSRRDPRCALNVSSPSQATSPASGCCS
jgi:ABC-type nitrate/sulfonate/bicarbonate transport system ATPase subunit